MRRVTDELASDGRITVGESPQLFARLSSLLWSGGSEVERPASIRRLPTFARIDRDVFPHVQSARQTITLPDLLRTCQAETRRNSKWD
jgi:hypothetical protein